MYSCVEVTAFHYTYKHSIKIWLTHVQNLPSVPWSKIAVSLPVWGLVIGQIGHNFGLFMIQTDLPKYMKSVLKFSVSQVTCLLD